MKKLIISAAVFCFFVLGASGDAFACSCLADDKKSEGKKVKAAYKAAAAVFYGEVTQIDRQADSLVVKFKIGWFWKGITAKEVIVRTAENSAMCGFNFEVGRKYLVYAAGEGENLETNICSRTSAQETDKKYLDKIKKPRGYDFGAEI